MFTINFPFKGQNFSALISFQQESYDMCYLIKYLDENLSDLIPGRRVLVSLSEGIRSPRELSRPAEDLVMKTTEAISSYLSIQ